MSIPVLEKDFYFAVQEGLNFSFGNPLDCHSEIMSESQENVEIVLWIGWNIKKSCDLSLLK